MDFRGCLAEATPARILWPRHIVSVSKRPDGRCHYEERAGPPPPNHAEKQDPNVMRVYFARAAETANEIRCAYGKMDGTADLWRSTSTTILISVSSSRARKGC